MRKTFLTLALLGLVTLSTAPAKAGSAVGDTAPHFKLTALDGKTYDLADLKGKTVVLEWANPNCPVSSRHTREKTMIELSKQYGEVVWLGVNSTNPQSGDYMKPADELAWNQKNGINYAVLADPTGATGHAYDAKTTPHMFIIDKNGKIAYNGAIDDDPPGRKAKAQRVNFVGKGIDAEKAGKSPDPASTRPYGCSVKY
ncbi:MAG TPA: redoxin domain-containing protein [Thermoanaerobaculia bacterium]|nr:redoxin domain-containing protein [Thermoanaerobaculia bacterium]